MIDLVQSTGSSLTSKVFTTKPPEPRHESDSALTPLVCTAEAAPWFYSTNHRRTCSNRVCVNTLVSLLNVRRSRGSEDVFVGRKILKITELFYQFSAGLTRAQAFQRVHVSDEITAAATCKDSKTLESVQNLNFCLPGRVRVLSQT